MLDDQTRALRRTRIASGVIATMLFAAGSIAIANGNSNFTCENCHDDEPTLCATIECSSNQVCSGNEGISETVGRWVEAVCVDKDDL